MKTSELIAKLAELQALHGDVDVVQYDDWSLFDIEKVVFKTDEFQERGQSWRTDADFDALKIPLICIYSINSGY